MEEGSMVNALCGLPSVGESRGETPAAAFYAENRRGLLPWAYRDRTIMMKLEVEWKVMEGIVADTLQQNNECESR
jgi:hypothetical protein